MLNHKEILKKLIGLEISVQKKYDDARAIGIDLEEMIKELDLVNLIREVAQKPLPKLDDILFEAKQGTRTKQEVLNYILSFE